MNRTFSTRGARFFTASLIFLAFATDAKAQVLYNNSKLGMSVDEVKRVAPTAIAPATRQDAAKGDIEKLRIESLEIAGRPFQVSYLFLNDKLTMVRLTLQKPGTEFAERNTYNSLENALRSKYGKELDRKTESGLFAGSTTIWVSGATDITLLSMALEKSSVLMVTYKASVAADASKL